MMFFATGDIHGDWKRLASTVSFIEEKAQAPIVLLIPGDFGIWDKRNLKDLDQVKFQFKDSLIFFVDGN